MLTTAVMAKSVAIKIDVPWTFVEKQNNCETL